MAYELDGTPIVYGTPFKKGDYRYTKGWWSISSTSEKTALGVREVADPDVYDQRFYWAKDKPKDIIQLKKDWIRDQKRMANNILADTDWLITRKAEVGTAVPSDTTTYRTAVRTKCKEREDQITACSDTAALAALINETGYLPGTESNGAEEEKKEVLDSEGNSKDSKEYESYDPKQWHQVINPAALKAWPTTD